MSMTRQIDVTAIIPVYGREDIFRTLKALEEFSYEGVVLWAIVVDNGNTDELSTRLKGLPDHYPWCSVIRLTENRGGAGAFRAGMEEAVRRNGDFVWLLDDDAQVNAQTLPGLLAEYRRLEDEGIRVGAVGGATLGLRDPNRAMEIGANISPFSGALRPRYRDVDIRSIRARTEEVDYVAAASLLVRTQVVREVGPFADVFIHYDDIEWCFRARRMGYRIFATTHSWVNHMESDGKIAPWVLYYDTRNQLWFLRKYLPFAWWWSLLRKYFQVALSRLHDCEDSAQMIALGVRHAWSGEVLPRACLPLQAHPHVALTEVFSKENRVFALIRHESTAALLQKAVEGCGASVTIVVCDSSRLGVWGRLRNVVRLVLSHFWIQYQLLRQKNAYLVFDWICAKDYPFPFWARRRVLLSRGASIELFAVPRKLH